MKNLSNSGLLKFIGAGIFFILLTGGAFVLLNGEKESVQTSVPAKFGCACGTESKPLTGPEIIKLFKESIHVVRGHVLETEIEDELNKNGTYTGFRADRVWKSFALKIEPTDEASILQRRQLECLRKLNVGENYLFFFEKDFHINEFQDFPRCKNSLVPFRAHNHLTALQTGLDLAEVSIELGEIYFSHWEKMKGFSNRSEINSNAMLICEQVEEEKLKSVCETFFSGKSTENLIPESRHRKHSDHDHADHQH